MRVFNGFLIVLFAGLAFSCFPEQEVRIYSVSYIFKDSASGWEGDFADYPVDSAGYHLQAGLDTLPYNINADSTKKAIRISGINGSDDLFMFIKRKVSGLRSNTTYELLFNVRLASNAPTGAAGIGGAPGESVYLKAGASAQEPERELVDDYYRLNIDKGNQAESGENMVVIGHIGVSSTTDKYALIVRNNSSANGVYATTDDAGALWLIVGTDSGFEGKTTLYYTQVDVLFNQVN
ncbi:MAG TPA: hypothetical protein VFM90_07585 [Cyclobacteriaceae bacterium]|nr:hypothetical protein [Cyclobacteriaceae bacterium]